MNVRIPLLSITTAAALAASAVPATGSPSQVVGSEPVAAVERSVDAAGWRDGGRITGRRDELLMDSSRSHVVVAVGTTRASFEQPRESSTIARRTPKGRWTRLKTHIGQPVGMDVNGAGDAVIISMRHLYEFSGPSIVATRWPRGAEKFRSRVLVKRSEPFNYSVSSVAANGHGDLAVLLRDGPRAQLLRKFAGEPWKRPLTIGRNRYDGVLDSVDILPTGAVVGAFKQDQTLSVRTLRPGSDTFGRATEVTTWSAIKADRPRDYDDNYATIKVGKNGDLATTWAYGVVSGDGGSELVTTRLNIVPATGRPYQTEFERSDSDIILLTVARDASVSIKDEIYTRRWNSDTRSFSSTSPDDSYFRDANVAGDVLIGGSNYGGPLQLWPVGKPPGPEVPSPRGVTGGAHSLGRYKAAAVLTADQRVYIATSPGQRLPHRFYLNIRQF